MSGDVEIRESTPRDVPLIEQLYPEAFPDEDLLPLVRELLKGDSTVLSLAAITDGTVVGHAAFTRCGVAGTDANVALLGPVAVTPDKQGCGIGSKLIRDGFRRLRGDGISRIYVLGDPAYYGRFGFEPDYNVRPPYPLPEEWCDAWQSVSLSDDELHLQGELTVPQPWRQRALWAP